MSGDTFQIAYSDYDNVDLHIKTSKRYRSDSMESRKDFGTHELDSQLKQFFIKKSEMLTNSEVKDVSGDGNCFFSAVVLGLLNCNDESFVYCRENVALLREKVCEFHKKFNYDSFYAPFTTFELIKYFYDTSEDNLKQNPNTGPQIKSSEKTIKKASSTTGKNVQILQNIYQVGKDHFGIKDPKKLQIAISDAYFNFSIQWCNRNESDNIVDLFGQFLKKSSHTQTGGAVVAHLKAICKPGTFAENIDVAVTALLLNCHILIFNNNNELLHTIYCYPHNEVRNIIFLQLQSQHYKVINIQDQVEKAEILIIIVRFLQSKISLATKSRTSHEPSKSETISQSNSSPLAKGETHGSPLVDMPLNSIKRSKKRRVTIAGPESKPDRKSNPDPDTKTKSETEPKSNKSFIESANTFMKHTVDAMSPPPKPEHTHVANADKGLNRTFKLGEHTTNHYGLKLTDIKLTPFQQAALDNFLADLE